MLIYVFREIWQHIEEKWKVEVENFFHICTNHFLTGIFLNKMSNK